MTKQYVAGTLDEKTRKDLMKFLADTRDPRTGPALAKAFNEYEPGKNDEDVKYAAKAVQGLAEAKKLTDQTVKDALWNCFAKFQVVEDEDVELVEGAARRGPRGERPELRAQGDREAERPGRSEERRQRSATRSSSGSSRRSRSIGEAEVRPGREAARHRPPHADEEGPARHDRSNALLKIAKDAEPVLIGALNGTDPDFAKPRGAHDKDNVGDRSPTRSRTSRARRDATRSSLRSRPRTPTRTATRARAAWLTQFPSDPRIVPAFLAAYKKIAPNASGRAARGANAHGLLAQASANFYDPSLTDWLVKEINAAKGDEADASSSSPLDGGDQADAARAEGRGRARR